MLIQALHYVQLRFGGLHYRRSFRDVIQGAHPLPNRRSSSQAGAGDPAVVLCCSRAQWGRCLSDTAPGVAVPKVPTLRSGTLRMARNPTS